MLKSSRDHHQGTTIKSYCIKRNRLMYAVYTIKLTRLLRIVYTITNWVLCSISWFWIHVIAHWRLKHVVNILRYNAIQTFKTYNVYFVGSMLWISSLNVWIIDSLTLLLRMTRSNGWGLRNMVVQLRWTKF